MVWVPDSLPAALRWPEKLIGSIWLSVSPIAHPCTPSLPPHPVPSPPFFPPALPSCGFCYPRHSHDDTSLPASCERKLCVCVCVRYSGEYGVRQGSQAPSCHHRAKGNAARQVGIFVPRPAGPRGRMRRERRTQGE